jgi:hypothetical protein
MRFLSGLFGRRHAAIGPNEAGRRVDDGAVLLDVREPSEWRAGHAPRARHIPLNDLDRRQRKLPAGREIHHGVSVRASVSPRRGDSGGRGARRVESVRWDAGLVGRRPAGRREGWTAGGRHMTLLPTSARPTIRAAAVPEFIRGTNARAVVAHSPISCRLC